MLGRLFQILLCFLLTMQPPSKSLSTDLYYRIVDSAPPVLVTLVDTVAAELANAARNVDAVDSARISPNFSDTSSEYNHVALKLSVDDAKNDSKDVPQDIPEKEQVENATQKDSEDNSVGTLSHTEESSSNISTEFVVENRTEVEPSVKIEVKEPESQEKQEEIPSFSEWAQKQLEEAEKNKEVVVNDSLHSNQNTVTSSNNFNVRSKNYASPDCGAKIVAANPEAGSSSFILSPSRDEYMLNTCNSRIWFIVELCEAIQAKKVELANFELFSSTPKNFSVSVSDRFPTREWAGVGQFVAKDERDIQTFNLYPHLFGKFIKVELHSHYGSEHYCPISLFRVYGTSEFEVFETENLPLHTQQTADEDEDDDVLEVITDPEKGSDASRNLFGSARDAVMSIMKKAAEVLVKGSNSNRSSTHLEINTAESKRCQTPSHIIVCDNCSNTVFSDVYELMSCHNNFLKTFVESPFIYDTLCNTDICQHFGLDFKSKKTSPHKTEFASYISAFLMPSYVAALCNMLAIVEKKVVLNTSYETDLNVTSNLTIDKKTHTISNEGVLNELIQGPFTCNDDDEYCKDEISDDFKPNLKTDANPILSDAASGSLSDIKPTKTLQKDNDATEPSVITVPAENNLNLSQNERTVENSYENSESKNAPNEISLKSSEQSNDNNSIDTDTPTMNNLTVEKDKIETISGTDTNNVNEPSNVSDSIVEESNSNQEQLSLDHLINELEQGTNDLSTPAPPPNTLSSLPQGQKESVFLRLSNRIKALEKNMSLSGQYLEELSRRYKKQVEEMQKTFEKTLLTVNEESKRSEERDHKNTEELLVLQQQIAHLSNSVAILLSERESWLGNVSLLKVFIFQIIITIIIIYLFRRSRRRNNSSVGLVNENHRSSIDKTRRKSDEILMLRSLNTKRRPSEEALNITCLNFNDSSNGSHKSEKRKKKKKTSAVQRSLSIATPAGNEFSNMQAKSSDDREWMRSDFNKSAIETPIALEEAEFIIPEVDPIDFSKIGEIQKPKFADLTPKKEFPKTNGSIFGLKTPINNKKPVKIRRLSSPAFLKSALGRQSSRSDDFTVERDVSSLSENAYIPKSVNVAREVRSEERDIRTDLQSSSLHEWSSAGELSQASSSATTNSSTKNKKSKKQSFKNMLKKVF
ncbi:SUN domain-containing ossification factor isoform X2 [Arctopsyche grandis]|uniref:SUN domain-containing ossification factor isoform X2 n=1 Tax=Arctopsyche grandis TaxID=121162 RepID=UPI00406D75B0